MGKSRKKKQKTADFQKVKLKVGKTKPAGANVTNTSFKTSTINIATQLKKETNVLTNKKSLSLKELLTQLNHYNVTVRHDALVGLLELFRMHQNIVHEQTNLWISKILEKMTDVDAAVRYSAQLCLYHVFNQLDSNEVLPFLKLIVAHICCGLTHLNSGVQLDMLNILDIILNNYPKLFVQHCSKILVHFMDLISKQTSKEKTSNQTLKTTKVKCISAMVSRELSVDVQSQLSSLKVRSQILEKLHKILHIIYVHGKEQKGDDVSNNNQYKIADLSEIFIPLHNRVNISSVDFDTWLSYSVSPAENTSVYIFGGDLQLHDLIHSVFPVLLNSWVEYEPGQLASCFADTNSLRSSLQGMKAIIEIINILIHFLIEMKHINSTYTFSEDYFKDMSTHFLNYFALPVMKSKSLTKGINKKVIIDPLQAFSIEFNFVMSHFICNILTDTFTIESINLDTKTKMRYIKQLVSFVTDALDSGILMDLEEVEKLIFTIKDLIRIKTKLTNKEAQSIDIGNLVKKLIQNYTTASVSSPWKIPVIHFFRELLSKGCYSSFMQDSECEKHVKTFVNVTISNAWSLPVASKSLIHESFSFIKAVLVCKLHSFIDERSLTNCILKIIGLENSLFCDLNENDQKTVMEIIFNMKKLSVDLVTNLALLCNSGKVGMDMKKYVASVLGYCLMKKDCYLEKETFINFILTVTLGFSVKDLMKINSENPRSISWCTLGLTVTPQSIEPVDHFIGQLKLLHYKSLWNKLVPVIGKLVAMVHTIPVRSAYGLVKLLERLSKWHHQSNTTDSIATNIDVEVNQLVDLLSGVFLYTFSPTYKSLLENFEGFESCDLITSCINLLVQTDQLLAWLVKKYVNLVEEYKMDPTCSTCVVELLLSLLQESRLATKLSPLKDNLQLMNAYINQEQASSLKKSIHDQFNLHVSML